MPGAYRNVCVELEVEGFAIAAIMCSTLLDAQDIRSMVQSSEEGLAGASSYAQDTACSRAFDLLKAVVTQWIHEFQNTGDPHAYVLRDSLYRYLCGHARVLLHDPAIHRFVYGLMVKLFKRIVHELKKLGANLVYANFQRIVIDTGKHGQASAKEYIDFILDALSSKELFRYLQIQTKQFYEQLVWLDPDNWSGLILPDLEGIAAADQEGYEEMAEEGSYEVQHVSSSGMMEEDGHIDKNLNNSSHRNKNKNNNEQADKMTDDEDDDEEDDDEFDAGNPLNAKYSKSRKSEYAFLDEIMGRDEEEAQDSQMMASQTMNGGNTVALDALAGREEIEMLDENINYHENLESHWNLVLFWPAIVGQYFENILMRFMLKYQEYRTQAVLVIEGSSKETDHFSFDQDIKSFVEEEMKNLIKNELSDDLIEIVSTIEEGFSTLPKTFPERVGSHLKLVSPALEFVKGITHVLSLDSSLSHEVGSLRRALLAQVKIREFSSESDFVDPCLSYVLKDVICASCNACKDLDLLRDLNTTGPVESRWNCTHCKSLMDAKEIENRLIAELESVNLKYTLQDLRCSQSRRVSTRICQTKSEMSNTLTMDMSSSEFKSKLNAYLRIAQFYQFTFLEDIVLEFLASSSSSSSSSSV